MSVKRSELGVKRFCDAGRAVFLSYASQDAEAVRVLAEALRAAGVEVWFDQNELVGGDAWDAKIRKQIGRRVRVICAGHLSQHAGAVGGLFPHRVETRSEALAATLLVNPKTPDCLIALNGLRLRLAGSTSKN